VVEISVGELPTGILEQTLPLMVLSQKIHLFDIRKTLKSLEYSSEAFAKLNPVRYNKKGSGVEEIGLIAEDVAALYPEVVKYDKDGNPDGVNYTRLSAILIKAVQELTDKVNQLEKNA